MLPPSPPPTVSRSPSTTTVPSPTLASSYPSPLLTSSTSPGSSVTTPQPRPREHIRQDDDAHHLRARGRRLHRRHRAPAGTQAEPPTSFGFTAKAPSTTGAFLRSFKWAQVRQLDHVSRELLCHAWGAGAGPGKAPLTIDLDSTLCETYRFAKEGAHHHGYTGQRGYHPLLAIAAGTGDMLMARLREGRANSARGAAHFLRESPEAQGAW